MRVCHISEGRKSMIHVIIGHVIGIAPGSITSVTGHQSSTDSALYRVPLFQQ